VWLKVVSTLAYNESALMPAQKMNCRMKDCCLIISDGGIFYEKTIPKLVMAMSAHL
jgi:hypothetical protein